MLTIPMPLRVFAHRFATDMRKSFSGLVGIIESELGQQVESGHLFLFFNRRRDRVKILFLHRRWSDDLVPPAGAGHV